ncbi:uncharacterized protein LOC124355079 [Homalodisca vitripennis]|uniref:uncharacterized protein LOC124355079 n=1 Tax=Homalodisca vitripennis TaxID=197043 RepID=UPI001EE9D939|nr:uncharacterized protein LOC124355079 [Homalodisca vitripennis]
MRNTFLMDLDNSFWGSPNFASSKSICEANLAAQTYPPTISQYGWAFQTPTVSTVFQTPTVSTFFQTPTVSTFFQTPTVSTIFQTPKCPPRLPNSKSVHPVFQTPSVSTVFQTPTVSTVFQTPTESTVFQTPTVSIFFQTPTVSTIFQTRVHHVKCGTWKIKKEYLQRAQLDKKRYREELKVYRNSDTYRSYLKRRRIKSCKTNGTEESDFDGTDEIDDEDNEELYCRACDQWFTTLHNKKEHLYGKQHFQAISQNVNSSFSLDESSLDGTSLPSRLGPAPSQELPSVPDAMAHFMSSILEREREMKILQERQKILMVRNKQILKELQELKQAQVKLQKLSCRQKEDQNKLEKVICDLWDVPALFYRKQTPY